MNHEFKIEKGIPMPVSRTYGASMSSIIKQMEVGDSIEILVRQQSTVQAAGRFHGFKLVTRASTEGKRRVWRVS